MIKSNLPELLFKKKWSQATLAKKTAIRPNAISEIYHGLNCHFNMQYINTICEVLGCEVSDIFEYVPNGDGREAASSTDIPKVVRTVTSGLKQSDIADALKVIRTIEKVLSEHI